MNNIIDDFRGPNLFLSNFYYCDIEFNGQIWKSTEHLFQGLKTVDESERERVRMAKTPNDSKYLGRRVTLVHNWERVKYEVMYNVLKMKFYQNPVLFDRLVNTGNSLLIEGNWWHDNTWGDCRCDKCKNKDGKNWLGRFLMIIREEDSLDNKWEEVVI